VQFALHHEEGQGLVEYALILVLIAVVAVGALVFLSGVINQLLSGIGAVI
jgi:pilus assembly protein Flp/PilA